MPARPYGQPTYQPASVTKNARTAIPAVVESPQMPATAKLAIYQGDDWGAMVTVTDSSTGAPADLTGCLAQAQIREGPADDCPEVEAEIVTTIDGNQIGLALPADVTYDLEGGQYAWDLQITRPDGTVTTVLAGPVFVTAEITREV